MLHPFNSFVSFLPRVTSFTTFRLNRHKSHSKCLKFARSIKLSGDHIFLGKNFSVFSSVSSLSPTKSEKLFAFKMSPSAVKNDWLFDLSTQDLLKRTDDLKNNCRQLYDKVRSVPDSDASCETVLQVRKILCLSNVKTIFIPKF